MAAPSRESRFWFALLCALCLALSGASVAYAEPGARFERVANSSGDEPDYTTDEDVDFARRFQQALRDDDRQWIVDRVWWRGLFVNANGVTRIIKSRKQILKEFNAIFIPEVKQALLNDDVSYYSQFYKSLFWIQSSGDPYAEAGFVVVCADRVDGSCRSNEYYLNNVIYDTRPVDRDGQPKTNSPSP